jgi:hypothetical protein
LAAEVERLKAELFKNDSEILAKKSEAKAEIGGVGGTLRAGRGPEFAKRSKELSDLQKLRAISNDQLKERETQLKQKRDEVAGQEALLAQLDGQIGVLNGQIDTAQAQIGLQGAASADGASDQPVMDASGGLNALETALASFRREPDAPTFARIQKQCAALLTTFEAIGELKAKSTGMRCDPGLVADQAGALFALNDGVARFKTGCGVSDNLARQKDTDALLEFGNRCVQDSGLAGVDTQRYRTELNRIALSRDDKAHRFVVTWNAFLDGNQLAYLALGIALALDGLVFMSGLFGANAIRSPLTDLEHGKGLSAQQLEGEIDGALGANPYASARMVLQALKPIPRDHGFVAEVDASVLQRESAETIRRVLSAATNIGGAERVSDGSDRYRVHGALLSYLSLVCKRQVSASGLDAQASDIKRAVVPVDTLRQRDLSGENEAIEAKVIKLRPSLEAALLPEIYTHAGWVLEAMRPTARGNEYASEIAFARGPVQGVRQVVLAQALNAGAAFGAILRDAENDELFLARPEFTQCLGEIRRDGYHDLYQQDSGGSLRLASSERTRPLIDIVAGRLMPPTKVEPRAGLAVTPPSASNENGVVHADPPAPLQRDAGIDTRSFLAKLASLLQLDQRHLHVMDEMRVRNWSQAIQDKLSKLVEAHPKAWGQSLDQARRVAEKDFKDARDMLIWGPRGLGLQGQQVDAEIVHAFSESFEIIHKLEEIHSKLRDDIETKQDAIGNDGLTTGEERRLDQERHTRDVLRRFIDGPVPSLTELHAALDNLIEPMVPDHTTARADNQRLN